MESSEVVTTLKDILKLPEGQWTEARINQVVQLLHHKKFTSEFDGAYELCRKEHMPAGGVPCMDEAQLRIFTELFFAQIGFSQYCEDH